MKPGDDDARGRLRVSGTYNLRDVGGLPTPAGRVRHGRLLRSDALHRLDDEGRSTLVELGLGTVVDLRDEFERSQSPSLLEGMDVELVSIPILEGSAQSYAQQAATLDTVYDAMVRNKGQAFASAVRAIANGGERAVLVHCTAGKDRTGLVMALVLSVVGVPRDLVVDDYARTAENLVGEWFNEVLVLAEKLGIPIGVELKTVLTASPAALLERILAEIDERFGSPEGYLLAHGLEPAEVEMLRDRLIEGAAARPAAYTE